MKTKLSLISALVAATAASAMADQVVVTAKQPGLNVLNSCPPFCETSASGTWSGTGSASHSSAVGDTAGGSVFAPGAVVGVPVCTVTPTLGTTGVYTVEVTHISGNASPNVIMGLSASGGTLSATQTDGFQAANGINTWYKICDLTNTTTTPTITFTYISGTQAATGGRIYMDGFRFTLQGLPCQNVPQLTTVNGPLGAGQTFVNVPLVSSSSTNVTVYSDTGTGSLTKIGSLTVSGATNAVVPVTPLVKGTYISASQWQGGQESCQLTAGFGQLVGGGANTSLGVCLNMIQDGSLSGPIGANGASTSTDFYFLGAVNRTGAFATAPAFPLVLSPSPCWQTVTIDPTTANYFHWNTVVNSTPDPNHYAELDALALAIADTDTGPYDIYIDNLVNGGVTIQDWEAAANGASGIGFSQPSFDSTPSGYLMSQPPGAISPNISKVATNQAAGGTKSLHVNWQFSSTANVNWVRLNAANHPIIDLTKPISFQILLLPVGTTNAATHVGSMATQTNHVGTTANFSATAFGDNGPFSYQWYDNTTNAISGATSSTYARPSVTTNDAGLYTVIVTDNNGCTNSAAANLVVNNSITPVPITISQSGGQITLNWTGSHTLQSSTDASGVIVPYTDVAGGTVLTGPYPVTPSATPTFYRLKN